MMHENRGTATSAAPSLFGDASAVTDKTLSILSAVTGREAFAASNPGKGGRAPARKLIPLFFLLIAAGLGWTFWQQGQSGLGIKAAPAGGPQLSGDGAPQPAMGKPARAPEFVGNMPRQAAEAITNKDVAVIETVSGKRVVAPIGQAPATTADGNKAGKADTHQPPLALAAPAPAKLKSDTKKTIATNTDKPNAGAISAQPDATQRTGKPKQAPSGVDKTVDSDEKLLETMLQLMNRSPAKEADRKSSAK